MVRPVHRGKVWDLTRLSPGTRPSHRRTPARTQEALLTGAVGRPAQSAARRMPHLPRSLTMFRRPWDRSHAFARFPVCNAFTELLNKSHTCGVALVRPSVAFNRSWCCTMSTA